MLAEDVRTVAEPKDLKLPTPQIQASINKVDDKTFEITVQSQVYAKAVKLDIEGMNAKFSDNFFDLIPNRKKAVTCHLEQHS